MRRLFGLCILLVVLVGAAPFLVSKFGKGFLEGQISSRINGTVTVDRISTGWFSGTVLEGVRLSEPGGSQPILAVTEARLDEGLLSLIRSSRKKATLAVTGVDVLAVMKEGKLNFASVLKENDEPTSDLPDLDLSVVVRNLKVSYQHESRAPMQIDLSRVMAKFATGRALTAQIESEGLKADLTGDIMTGARMKKPQEMTGSASLTLDQWSLEQLRKTGIPALESLSGSAIGNQDLAWDGNQLTVKGKIKLQDVKTSVPEMGLYQVGLSELTNQLRVTMNQGPEGRIELLVDSLVLPRQRSLKREIVLSALAAADISPTQQVAWELLHLRSEGFEVKGLGTTDLLNNMTTSAELRTTGDLKGMHHLMDGLPELAGALESNAKLEWSLLGDTKVQGRTVVRNLVAKNLGAGTPDMSEAEVAIDHNFRVSKDLMEATATSFHASFAQATLTGSLRFPSEGRGTQGDMRFQASADLDRLSKLLGGLLPARFVGQLSADGRLVGGAGGLTVDARVGGKQISIHGDALTSGPVTLGDLTLVGRGTISEDFRSLDFPELRVDSSALTGTAKVNLTREEGGQRGQIDFDLNGQVAPLLAMVPGLPSVSGALSSRGQLVLNAAEPMSVRGRTQIANLVATGLPGPSPEFRDALISLDHDLDYGNGQIRARKAEIKSSFLQGEVTGSLVSRAAKAPEGKVEFQFRGDLGRLASLLGSYMPMTLAGALRANGFVEGVPLGYQYSLDASGDAVVLSGASLGPTPLNLGQVSVKSTGFASSNFDRLQISRGQLESQALRGQLTADLTKSGDVWTGPLDATFSGEAGRLLAFYGKPLPVQIQGASEFVAKVVMGATSTFDGTIKGRQLTLTGSAVGPTPWQIVTFDADLAGTYAMTQGSLQLQKLKVGSDPMQFELTRPLVISGLKDGMPLSMTAHFKGAANLQRIPGHVLAAPVDANVGGIAQFEGAMNYGTSGIRGNITASVSQLVVQRPAGASAFGSPQFVAQALEDGTFRINLDASSMQVATTGAGARTPTPLRVVASGRSDAAVGSVDITSIEISGSGIRKATGSGRFSPTSHRLVLDADLNMAELSNTWLAVLDSGIKGNGAGKLNVQLDLPASGTDGLRRGTGQWTASLEQVTAKSLDLRNVQLDGNMTGGIARITKGNGTLNGGAVTVTGQADFRNEQPTWQGAVQANQVTLREELRPAIARALPIFAGLGVNAGGVLNGQFNLTASGKAQGQGAAPEAMVDWSSLSGTGLLGMSSAFIEGGPLLSALTQIAGIPPRLDLNAFQSNFQVTNGRVRQNTTISTAQNLDLRITGTTSVTGELDYILGIRLNGPSNQNWQRYTNLIAKDGFLPLSMKGTVTNPGIPMPDPGQLIQGAAENLINRGLSDLFGGKKKKEEEKKPEEKKQ
jgi:hypothetical protein